MTVGENNALYEPLVPCNKIIFPLLHIKADETVCQSARKRCMLGIHMQSISWCDHWKAQKRYSPDIRKLIKDQNFITSMNELESKTWRSFIAVTKNFLINKWSDDYVSLVQNMLDNYCDSGVNMSIKVHFLNSHLDRFSENCGDISDEQGKWFRPKNVSKKFYIHWIPGILVKMVKFWSFKKKYPA